MLLFLAFGACMVGVNGVYILRELLNQPISLYNDYSHYNLGISRAIMDPPNRVDPSTRIDPFECHRIIFFLFHLLVTKLGTDVILFV